MTLADYEEQLLDMHWRLNNLYTIQSKEGECIPFRMNRIQERLCDEMHNLNIILKARQLGASTFACLYMLDQCLWNDNVTAGVIAHTLDDAKGIFDSKIKFPYDNLDPDIKARVPAISDSKTELVLANRSSISVGTSHRSGTLQILLVSEYGKICAKFPDKAREVRAGALNTIAPGQVAFIESTAEGREGDFFERVNIARALKEANRSLTTLDWKFHFFPWWEDPSYALDPDTVVLNNEDKDYFHKLESQGVMLTAAQKAWYAKKLVDQTDDMGREFPSTPDEAFEQAIEGAYFARQMMVARREQRIGRVPIDQRRPINTFWDIGINDLTSIWLHQEQMGANRFVAYFHNDGEGLPYYINWLRDWGTQRGIIWGKHYGPHDIDNKEFGSGISRKAQALKLGFKFEVVPRVMLKANAIEAARNVFSTCYFDEANCNEGIKHLDHYRKDWNDTLGIWRDTPRHDINSHGADAFLTFATGYRALPPVKRVDAYRRDDVRTGPHSYMGV